MGEIRKALEVERLLYECDECKKGMLEFTGQQKVENNEHLFLNRCFHCGFQEYFEIAYPVNVYIPMDYELEDVQSFGINYDEISTIDDLKFIIKLMYPDGGWINYKKLDAQTAERIRYFEKEGKIKI